MRNVDFLRLALLLAVTACSTPAKHAVGNITANGAGTAVQITGRQADLVFRAISAVIAEYEPNARAEDFVATFAEQSGITTIYLARSRPTNTLETPHLYTVLVQAAGMTVQIGIEDRIGDDTSTPK